MRIFSAIVVFLFSFCPASDVFIVDFDGAVDPPSAQYVLSAIEQAEAKDASLLLIILDTPGGLMSSMKQIVDGIVNSEVPVAVYVYPRGARAASAGLFITMAANIAAMAPGTHIGAAHPVSIGFGADTSKVMTEKVTNDAVAWLRSLAQIRHRNTEWLERAVKYSESITASEAESIGVIDFVASNVEELLEKISEMEIIIDDTTITVDVKNADTVKISMSFQQKVLHTILNPNIAYLLLILGLLGIYFELQHPGVIAPGVVGVISLLSAIYAFQILPVNYIGVLLIITGIVMFILEVKVPGFGVLTSGGIIALLLGSFMLTSGNAPELSVDWWTIVPTVLFVALFFIFVVAKALLAQKSRPQTGAEGILGEIGEVSVKISPQKAGKIFVHGEIWNARSDEEIPEGVQVKIVKVDGMMLWVKPIDE